MISSILPDAQSNLFLFGVNVPRIVLLFKHLEYIDI